MKLLIYSHFFPPSIGGTETIVLSLAKGLAELRTANGAPEFEVTLVTETEVERFDDASLPFRVVRQPNLFRLWGLVRCSDVVHLAGPALPPLFLTRLARKPTAIEHHGYQAVCPNGLLIQQPKATVCAGHFLTKEYGKCLRCIESESSWIRSWLRLMWMFPRFFLTKHASANIAISNHFATRSSLPRLVTIYHGIEETPNGDHIPPLGAGSKRIAFAYVGRLVSEKGVPVLLEAARLLLDANLSFQLLLIGDGPERPRLEAMIAQHQLQQNVRILGFLSGKELADALREVDVVVMPSLWEETAGLAAMEQMMRGRLVLASHIGGLGEIVSDAGMRFRPGDAGALAEAMSKVIEDPSIAEVLGSKARQRAQALFTRERMIAEHAGLYRRLGGDRSKQASEEVPVRAGR